MRINLLPAEYRPAPLFDAKRIIILALSSFLVFGSLLSAVFLYLQANSSKENLRMVTQQREALQSEKLRVEQAENRLAEIQKRFTEIAGLKKTYLNYPVYLNTFSKALVAEIWLKSISFSSGSVTIDGNTLSFAIIGDLIKNLEKSNFTSVRLAKFSEETKDTWTYYSFTINIQTKEGGVQYAQ